MKLYRAKDERQCGRCKAKIAAGDAYYAYRERATSSAEARNAGTLYPKRRLCTACGDKRKLHQLPVANYEAQNMTWRGISEF